MKIRIFYLFFLLTNNCSLQKGHSVVTDISDSLTELNSVNTHHIFTDTLKFIYVDTTIVEFNPIFLVKNSSFKRQGLELWMNSVKGESFSFEKVDVYQLLQNHNGHLRLKFSNKHEFNNKAQKGDSFIRFYKRMRYNQISFVLIKIEVKNANFISNILFLINKKEKITKIFTEEYII